MGSNKCLGKGVQFSKDNTDRGEDIGDAVCNGNNVCVERGGNGGDGCVLRDGNGGGEREDACMATTVGAKSELRCGGVQATAGCVEPAAGGGSACVTARSSGRTCCSRGGGRGPKVCESG